MTQRCRKWIFQSVCFCASAVLGVGAVAAQSVTWTQKFPTTTPSPPRFSHAMAYDAARDQVVLFGGNKDPANQFFDETWVWDGLTWTQKFPATSPSERQNHVMAYDAARGQVVLFGGYDTQSLGDTWVWDGSNWTRKTPATSPTSRHYHAMAYDAVRGEVVLFGGASTQSGIFGDTWVWDGTNWTQRTPATSPSTRYGHAMAYDATRGEVVLFGGNSSGLNQGDTWVWDGANWTQKSAGPPARYWHAMAGDLGVVLFGGQSSSGAVFGDTWVWDGATWDQQSPTTNPPARIFHAMAYDAARNQVLMFGGDTFNQGTVLTDTWTFPENQPPDCSAAEANPSELWPPNHKGVPISIVGVTDLDGDEVCIAVDSIRQDEPVLEAGTGSGKTCPDGAGVDTATAKVRAERAGNRKVPGDGRVYHIAFTADDGMGGTCRGEVTVCVPHDQRPGHVCVDQGALFDSTVCP